MGIWPHTGIFDYPSVTVGQVGKIVEGEAVIKAVFAYWGRRIVGEALKSMNELADL